MLNVDIDYGMMESVDGNGKAVENSRNNIRSPSGRKQALC